MTESEYLLKVHILKIPPMNWLCNADPVMTVKTKMSGLIL